MSDPRSTSLACAETRLPSTVSDTSGTGAGWRRLQEARDNLDNLRVQISLMEEELERGSDPSVAARIACSRQKAIMLEYSVEDVLRSNSIKPKRSRMLGC